MVPLSVSPASSAPIGTVLPMRLPAERPLLVLAAGLLVGGCGIAGSSSESGAGDQSAALDAVTSTPTGTGQVTGNPAPVASPRQMTVVATGDPLLHQW